MKNKVEDECGMMQISVGNPAVVFRTHSDFGHSWSCPLLCQPQKGLHSNAFQCIQLLCAYWLTSSFFIYTVSNPLCLQKEATEFLETELFGPQVQAFRCLPSLRLEPAPYIHVGIRPVTEWDQNYCALLARICT